MRLQDETVWLTQQQMTCAKHSVLRINQIVCFYSDPPETYKESSPGCDKGWGMIGFRGGLNGELNGNSGVGGRRSRCWGGSRDRPWQRGGVDGVDCRRESVRLE